LQSPSILCFKVTSKYMSLPIHYSQLSSPLLLYNFTSNFPFYCSASLIPFHFHFLSQHIHLISFATQKIFTIYTSSIYITLPLQTIFFHLSLHIHLPSTTPSLSYFIHSNIQKQLWLATMIHQFCLHNPYCFSTSEMQHPWYGREDTCDP
jgi:hypothetical protein